MRVVISIGCNVDIVVFRKPAVFHLFIFLISKSLFHFHIDILFNGYHVYDIDNIDYALGM